MADNQAARERREKIGVEEYLWGTAHTGGREALIAAGLAKPEHFPGEPGCGKSTTDFPPGHLRKFTVSRRSKHLYVVSFHRTPEEIKAATARENAKRDRKLLSNHQEMAIQRLAAQGTTPKAIAKACLDGTCLSAIMAFNMTDDPSRPYRFPEDVKAKVKVHVRAIMDLFERGGFEPRTGAVTEADPDFQRFMRNAAGGDAKP